MTKKQKADIIIRELEKLYPNPEVTLNYKNDFTFLIAVMLSAQATDKSVNLVTPQLFEKADNAFKMSLLLEQEILSIIKPVGLANTKSKNVLNTSKILAQRYNGEVPQSLEELEKLPGVGHKTASVVISQIFSQDAFPVDTHIHRMLFRWGISDGSSVRQTEKDAKETFDKKTWKKLHLQIIYYAREYSPSQRWDKEKDFLYKMLNC